ncbi:MAG: acyltransferase family protein [Candidatus Ancillula sp.]|jgi:fucose 4-O-acetylase-like acetyltransferase|nr:acyltransferase family protein [Candidatus Ancillula sp.]
MKKRVRFIDIARGIAILCVIVRHFPIYYNVGWFSIAIKGQYDVLNSFIMAIFFIISGYCFNANKFRYKKILLDAKKLLIPYFANIVIWICVLLSPFVLLRGYNTFKRNPYNMFESVVMGLSVTIKKGSIFNGPVEQIGAIWFFLSFFIALVCFKLIMHLTKFEGQRILIISFFTILGVETYYNWLILPFDIQPAFCALPFMYFGYILKKIKLFEKFSILVLFSSGLIFLSSVFIKHGIAAGGIPLAKVSEYLIGVGSSIFILSLSQLIEKIIPFKFTRPIEFYGRNSLALLCFHHMEIHIFRFSAILTSTLWIHIVLFFVLPMLAVLVFWKVPVINKIYNIS